MRRRFHVDLELAEPGEMSTLVVGVSVKFCNILPTHRVLAGKPNELLYIEEPGYGA